MYCISFPALKLFKSRYGKSNKQIAKKLKISEWTVSTHLRRVFTKLKVDSRAEMVYNCASLVRYRIALMQQKESLDKPNHITKNLELILSQ